MANVGDTILILGKGDETFIYREFGREPWMSCLLYTSNASYPDLRVSEAQLLQLQAQACFSPEGWVVALDRQSGKPLACGIAALDRQMQEISLEWIQVLPGKRGRGIGRSLVMQLLSNMKDRARFATVSGRADGPCSPELFYRQCGFTGDDIWIVRRETLQAKQKAGSSGRESKK